MTQPPVGPQQPWQPHQGPHPQQVGPQPVQAPEKPKRRFGVLSLGVAALAGLVLGSCGGALVAGGGDATATTAAPAATVTAPAPTVTVTETTAPEASEPTEVPAEEAVELKPADFEINLKILGKECFGTAGCIVDFRIDPQYVGDQALPDGEIEVTYEVTGGEDGPMINTFTIADGEASFEEEESADTSSSSKKLKAKATDVSVS